MVGRIYHVGLTVSDLDRSIAFYRDMKRSMAAALRNRNYLVLESAVWYYMLVLFTMGEIICSLRWMR